MSARGGHKGGGGPGRGRGRGATVGDGVATSGDGAAGHAAAEGRTAAQGQKYTVAANTEELRAVLVPYPTATAHNGDWRKVHDVAYTWRS